jgi:hypothetical protein
LVAWHQFGNLYQKKRAMNKYEAAAFIEEILPEAHIFEKNGRLSFDINRTMTCLTDFLKRKLLQHDMGSVKKILSLVEVIYRKGDPTVRTSIENILVFSLSAMLPHDKWQRNELQVNIPVSLYKLYVHQIIHSNI